MRLVPIAGDGWRFILPFTVAGVFFLWLRTGFGIAVGAVFLLLAGFCAYFFRDFERLTPSDPTAIYSPGDGRVLDVAGWDDKDHPGWKVIRIFLSVFDGHVQRSPIEGRVQRIEYRKGTFLDARDPRAHLENEQNTVTMTGAHGTLMVKQIAGLVARRIVCWVKEGQELGQGERYGLIRFGSQVDVLIPPGVAVTVDIGQRVVGGKTVVARWTK